MHSLPLLQAAPWSCELQAHLLALAIRCEAVKVPAFITALAVGGAGLAPAKLPVVGALGVLHAGSGGACRHGCGEKGQEHSVGGGETAVSGGGDRSAAGGRHPPCLASRSLRHHVLRQPDWIPVMCTQHAAPASAQAMRVTHAHDAGRGTLGAPAAPFPSLTSPACMQTHRKAAPGPAPPGPRQESAS